MNTNVKPFIKLYNKTIDHVKSWLESFDIKFTSQANEIRITGFGKDPILVAYGEERGKFTLLTPLGSICKLDTINFGRKNLHFYFADYLQFSTEKFNV